MDPTLEPLVMYGQPSEHEALEWGWVERQLADADAYWVSVASHGHPHPRPVWGVWADRRLHVSVGSPLLAAGLGDGVAVTAHLGGILDVVIVEGVAVGQTGDAAIVSRYDAKYDWTYDLATYGPLTTIAPGKVIAWRAAGTAGRDGFVASGRWSFAGDPDPDPAPGLGAEPR